MILVYLMLSLLLVWCVYFSYQMGKMSFKMGYWQAQNEKNYLQCNVKTNKVMEDQQMICKKLNDQMGALANSSVVVAESLRDLLDSEVIEPGKTITKKKNKRTHMSAEHRRKISEAMKERYAKKKGKPIALPYDSDPGYVEA